jgi:hypothetical protein
MVFGTVVLLAVGIAVATGGGVVAPVAASLTRALALSVSVIGPKTLNAGAASACVLSSGTPLAALAMRHPAASARTRAMGPPPSSGGRLARRSAPGGPALAAVANLCLSAVSAASAVRVGTGGTNG